MSTSHRNTRLTDFASWCRQWLTSNDARALLYASAVYSALLLLMFGSWTLFTPQAPEPVQAVRVHVAKPSDVKTSASTPPIKKPATKAPEPTKAATSEPKDTPKAPAVSTELKQNVEKTAKDKVKEKSKQAPEKKPASKTKPKAESKPEPKKQPKSELKSEPTPDKKSEVKSKKEIESTKDVESKKQAEAVTETTTHSVTKTDAHAQKPTKEPVKKTQDITQETSTTTTTSKPPEIRQPKKTNFADLLDDEPDIIETSEPNTTPTQTAASEISATSGQLIEDAEATFSATQLAEKDAQVNAIKSAVELAWVRPASATNQMSVEVEVRLLADGKIMKKTLAQSSGNAAFDQSVLAALEKVEYLPVPDDAALFDAYFRELLFKFSPDDL